MSRARETTVDFSLCTSPLDLRACAAKIDFFSLMQVVAFEGEGGGKFDFFFFFFFYL